MIAPRRALVLLAAVAVFLVLGVPRAVADTVAFSLSDSRLTAPVGLATDKGHSLYWTANATAEKGHTTVYAVGADGSVRAEMTYGLGTTGALAVAYDTSRVMLLDKASSTGLRLMYMTLGSIVVNGSLQYHYWDLTLPESGQTPVALIVEPDTQVYVVAQSGAVFKAPSKLSVSGRNTMTKAATVANGVTGGYYDATLKAVVLRTASQILVVDPTSFSTTRTIAAPAQNGARGITSSLDGASFLLTASGAGSDVLSVAQQGGGPSASSASAGSASSTPSPSVTETVTTTNVSNGPLWAFGAALVLAVAASAVALGRR